MSNERRLKQRAVQATGLAKKRVGELRHVVGKASQQTRVDAIKTLKKPLTKPWISVAQQHRDEGLFRVVARTKDVG